MKILFLVQGEGRGHLTQAIALSQILETAGHEIAAAMVGASPERTIPSFFAEQISAPVLHFDAPNIIYNAHGGMDLKQTIFKHLTYLPKYLKSLRKIREVVQDINPHLIISFYEGLGGLCNLLYRSKIPMVCVAHQYLLLHPKFVFPEKPGINKILINLNSRATSWLASKRLALSFREMESRNDLKITIIPPLLRREVINLSARNDDFFLVYLTHQSLSKQVTEWHAAHTDVTLHCFWDNPEAPNEYVVDENLTFHKINSEKYLRMLASCRALVTTAGFESVCEAMYLGKPVMMVPVPNHFEQACNAMDGVISGAGVMSKVFDLSVLLDYLPRHIDQSEKFRAWYHRGEAMFTREIQDFEQNPHAISS